MSKWLNNKTVTHKIGEVEKPCAKLGYCAYGQLVEKFPLNVERGEMSCKVFGHNCPIYYLAEKVSE